MRRMVTGLVAVACTALLAGCGADTTTVIGTSTAQSAGTSDPTNGPDATASPAATPGASAGTAGPGGAGTRGPAATGAAGGPGASGGAAGAGSGGAGSGGAGSGGAGPGGGAGSGGPGSSASTQPGQRYSNPTFGYQVTIPNGWVKDSAASDATTEVWTSPDSLSQLQVFTQDSEGSPLSSLCTANANSYQEDVDQPGYVTGPSYEGSRCRITSRDPAGDTKSLLLWLVGTSVVGVEFTFPTAQEATLKPTVEQVLTTFTPRS